MEAPNLTALAAAAGSVRANAYAPYSVYNVGAALLADDGNVYVGCNVENASFGLTVCAERNAVGSMVAGGARRIDAIAVATEDGNVPCGACLQVLSEFVRDGEVTVALVAADGSARNLRFAELLPNGFDGGPLKDK